MPLRDMLRGAMVIEAESRSMLEPAAARLPAPLRHIMGLVGQALDSVKASTVRAERPSPSEIRRAAQDLAQRSAAPSDIPGFGRVAAFGLETALRSLGVDHLLVSETVATVVFARISRQRLPRIRPQDRAAQIAAELTQRHVAGAAPGTGVALGRDDRERIQLAILAVMIWLLAERPLGEKDEERILLLSVALAQSLAPEFHAAHDQTEVAALLDRAAGMI